MRPGDWESGRRSTQHSALSTVSARSTRKGTAFAKATSMLQAPSNQLRSSPALELTDPVQSARAAGLRYVLDAGPGIRRRRAGKGFAYTGPDGRPIRDPGTLKRIRSLVIPPAWTDVWICPDPGGHLQATGFDARHRKQYRYHPRWRQVRDAVKYDRMLAFAEALPAIRARTDRDLALPGMPREKVLAAVVQLLENTLIRVGNEEYRRENRSFGLTTLRNHHAEVMGSRVRFRFRGKSGKQGSVEIADRRLARVIRQCQEIPGQGLFQYVDESGERATIGSEDVNEYLREASGGDFTAKDFRTWAGSVLAVDVLSSVERAESERERRKQLVAAVDEVALQLGNTPAVCRKCYVHPAVIDAFENGVLSDALQDGPEPGGDGAGALSREEQVLVRVLRWLPPVTAGVPAAA